MKKVFSIVIVLCSVSFVYAQHQILSFFDDKGNINLETQQLNEITGKMDTTFHRADDVVWSRVVYRVIDMRFKQNYQLYTPVKSGNPQYRSLFNVILDAIVDMPMESTFVYAKSTKIDPQNDKYDIKPDYESALTREQISNLLDFMPADKDPQEPEKMLDYDTINNVLTFNAFNYDAYVKNQLKYLIQEVVFFDKHYSRVYTKILAIAPLHANMIGEAKTPMAALYGQLLFWIPFDALRPYLQKQYIMPLKNDTKRVTYDDFFMQRLFSSYLVGDSNIYDRMIPEYAKTSEEIHKEQQRIEAELLSVEQDLWEY